MELIELTVDAIAKLLQDAIANLDHDEQECLTDIVRDYDIQLPSGLTVFAFVGSNGEYAAVYDSDCIKGVFLDLGESFKFDLDYTEALKRLDGELRHWETYSDNRYWYLSLDCKNYNASESDIEYARSEILAYYKEMGLSFLGRCGGHLCVNRYPLESDETVLSLLASRYFIYPKEFKACADKLKAIRLEVEEFTATDFTSTWND